MSPKAQGRIASEVSSWKGVVAGAHRFGGTEFRVGRRDLGHTHGDLQVDIPFPMEVRNRLIDEGKAEPHHFLPESGWVTFRVRTELDVERAIDLFKLAYQIALQRETVTAD